jgi:5-hydroxyisourate hydrolase
MSGISTHVLDTTSGLPAAGVPVWLEFLDGQTWKTAARATTDASGRVAALLPAGGQLLPGFYRLNFDVAAYFEAQGRAWFFPHVAVTFGVSDAAQHYHLPLLLSAFGYTTYRGS